jgi:hypothetical protein
MIKFPRFVAIATSVVIGLSFMSGCGSAESSSNSGESSDTEQTSNSAVDKKIKATVKCTITEIDSDDVTIGDETNAGANLAIAAKAYFYYDETVTVTNYTNESKNVYVSYRLVDQNGKVFETRNFRELVGAGETLTMDDNRIVQPATEIVVFGDKKTKSTSFDCPVVEARISG